MNLSAITVLVQGKLFNNGDKCTEASIEPL